MNTHEHIKRKNKRGKIDAGMQSLCRKKQNLMPNKTASDVVYISQYWRSLTGL